MAATTCSFLNATNARSLARNQSIIWKEICGIQDAILAAIDDHEYSVIVNGGTPMTSTQPILSVAVTNGGSGYDLVVATAQINANGTGGTGAVVVPVVTGSTITGFSVTAGGSGYAPVSATASLASPSNLIDAQNQTNYDGIGGDGTFAAGLRYRAGEVITLSDSSTATVNTIGATTGVVTIASQTETNFDGAGSNGTFVGGDGIGSTSYAISDTITLNDGSVVLVNAIAGNGNVTQFTIQSGSLASVVSGSTLVQIATSGSGAGFTLTLGTNNQTNVGPVATFTVGSPASVPFFYPATLAQSTTTGIGTGFSLTPGANNISSLSGGSGAVLTPLVNTSGAISAVIIGAAGTGYITGTPVVFTHPSGVGAVATVTSVGSSGQITAITVSAGGSGYLTAVATVTVSHPTGFGFAGTVQVVSGAVTGVSIQNGGALYTDLNPTATVTDPTGSGAVLSVNLTSPADGTIASIDVVAGGFGYTSPSVVITPAPTDNGTGAAATATVGANTFGTTPSEYHAVIIGQSSNREIEDQIQYVLDYFTALNYNIRVQTNPATNNTIQWQLIW